VDDELAAVIHFETRPPTIEFRLNLPSLWMQNTLGRESHLGYLDDSSGAFGAVPVRMGGRQMLEEETDGLDTVQALFSYQQLLQKGFCGRKLETSLLGLDWCLFEPRAFPEHAGEGGFRNPPEFLFLAVVTLDAYATSVFASTLKHGDFGALTFTCRLKGEGPSGRLRLEFVTVPERGRLCPKNVMVEMLSSLPQLLQAKKVEGDVYYLSDAGCRMQIPYSGKLVAELCSFLHDRPGDLWPEVTLTIRPTEELVARARSMVDFVWNSRPLRGIPS
jgi:hypothetical protein